MVSTFVTQSRMASLVASFNVAVPECTGRTCGERKAASVRQPHSSHAPSFTIDSLCASVAAHCVCQGHHNPAGLGECDKERPLTHDLMTSR